MYIVAFRDFRAFETFRGFITYASMSDAQKVTTQDYMSCIIVSLCFLYVISLFVLGDYPILYVMCCCFFVSPLCNFLVCFCLNVCMSYHKQT